MAKTQNFKTEVRQLLDLMINSIYTNKEILLNYTQTLTEYQESKLGEILDRRKTHYPLQYILEEWSFYGLPFLVGPGALIPRMDTEAVVEKALELIKDKKLLFVDDSIVRGTQLRETTDFLYESGAKEVHIRPACPPLVYGCKYLNFSRSTSEMELITRRVIQEMEGDSKFANLTAYANPETPEYQDMVKKIGEKLNFTSLRYHRLDDMMDSVGIDKSKLCTYCWDGRE